MADDRMFGRRFSRRRALVAAGTGAVGLAAAALIGCSSNGTKAGTGPGNASVATAVAGNAKPKAGGALKFAEIQDTDSLDPFRSGGGLPHHASFVYSRLFTLVPGDGEIASGKVTGDLVETWEQPDPLTMVMHLNKAAKFDTKAPLNGRSVTAEDVVQTWKRYSANDTYRTQLAHSANPTASVDGMEVIDPSTVRVKFVFPDPTALSLMAGGIWIQPVEGLTGKIDLAKEQRGSGPFLLDSYKQSVGSVYKRNPNWFGGANERPYVDEMDIGIIPDQAQRDIQFRAKNLHFNAVSPTNIVQFAKELNGTEIAVGGPTAGSPILVFSYAPGQPWHDVRVRRAMSMGVDRDQMADVLFDPKQFESLGVKLTNRWNAPISGISGAYWLDPKSKDFGPSAQYLQHNVAEATKLLAAAGFTSAKPLEVDNVYPGLQWGTNWPQRVAILQAMMKDIGVKMNDVSVDYTTDYTPNFMRAKANFKGKTTPYAVHFMPGGSGGDPLAFYFQFFSATGSSSMVGKEFPELEAMEAAAQKVSNFDDRVANMHNLNRWMTDNMAVWPVGPAFELVDLVWKGLRGPQQYRTWGGTNSGFGFAGNMNTLDKYWFQGTIQTSPCRAIRQTA